MIRQITEIGILEYLTREVQRNEEMWGKNSIDAQKARERRDKALREMKEKVNGKVNYGSEQSR